MKAKVVLSFTLAIVTFVVLGFLAYGSFNKLLSAIHQISEPNAKLKSMHAIVMHLSQAESSIRAYATSKNRRYYRRYLEEVDVVNDLTNDLMKSDWQFRVEATKLDSISLLLHRKIISLQEFLNYQDKNKVIYSEKALNWIDENGLDSTALTTISSIKSTQSRLVDTILVYKPIKDMEKAKGIFNKISQLLSKKKPQIDPIDTVTRVSEHTQYEYDTSTVLQPDTILINEVKETLQQIREEEYNHHRAQAKREMKLLEANSSIINQIREVIQVLEESESEYYAQQKQQARTIVHHNVINIVIIIIAAFLGCLICILLIFRDISKSNYYKGRLEQAKSRAERMASVKEEFLANVSHELRTPLNAVVGFSEQLDGTQMSAKQRYYVSIINNSSRHLCSLVNDILDMSKIESGTFELNETHFNLRGIIEETYQIFRVHAKRKGIEMHLEIPGAVDCILRGDDVRLRQVLFNVMDNAIKFTDQGEVFFCTEVERIDPGGVALTFMIRDSGVGIPEGQLHKIFDNFYQGDSSTSKKHLGTGLGLAISKKIIQALGGEIHVQSSVNVGTTFIISVRFPLSKQQSEAKAVEEWKCSKHLAEARLLVIDDDHFNTALLQVILKEKVQQLQCVSTAGEGFKAIHSQVFDLILTDIHMPFMDGVALLKEIRSGNSFNKNAPVVAVTADATKPAEFWLEQGFSGFISKPFDQNNALWVLSGLMEKWPGKQIVEENKMDLQTLTVLAGGEAGVMVNLLEVFRENAAKDAEKLRCLYDRGLIDELKEQAHKMKSPFGQLGMTEAVNLLRMIERCEWTEVRDYGRYMDRLTVEIAKVLELVAEKIRQIQVDALIKQS